MSLDINDVNGQRGFKKIVTALTFGITLALAANIISEKYRVTPA